MQSNFDVHAVRALVRSTLPHFDLAEDATCSESILIRGGFYAGRRFDFGSVQAIWAVEEPQVAFADRNGHVIRVVEQHRSVAHEARRAA